MTKPYTFTTNFYKHWRILIHVLFWIVMVIFTAIVYGYGKYEFSISLSINLYFLTVHILYFYVVAYFLIPKFLFTKRYIIFLTLMILLVFTIPFLTRLIDIFLVEPSLDAYLNARGLPKWYKTKGTFMDRLFNPSAYMNAFKGTNLIVWFAIVIKFFKLWYDRHHAALQAELSLLKGQIHPHFLFNTLNNLYALTLNQSPKSPEIVIGLAGILRYMLYECNTDRVELKKDIEILEHYITLEKIRYEERLDFNFSKNAVLNDYQIAPLLLLPLVENAFKHGTSEQVGQAWINIDLSIKDRELTFKIANSKALEVAGDADLHYGHIGLDNVKKRLNLLYPKSHDLKIFNEEEMFVVILKVKLN